MRRILVVDDDKMNLRRTRLILEKYYEGGGAGHPGDIPDGIRL